VPDDDSLDFGTGDFTASFWFNLAGIDFPQVLAQDSGGIANYAISLAAECNTSTHNRLFFEIVGQNLNLPRPHVCGNTPASLGEWHHGVAIRRGSQIEVYLDGQLDGTTYNIDQLDVNNDRPLCIGCSYALQNVPAGGFFNGCLDEVKLWKRALSAAEIASEYQQDAPPAGQEQMCGSTPPGTIIVDKVTNPSADPQSFTFTPSYGSNFSLTDTATPNNSGLIVPGTYSVSETVPSGWDLTSSTCSDGSSPASISLQAGETVTCTFTNTKNGTIIVDKVTNPIADPQSFTFTAGGSGYSGFSLTDAATPNSQSLVPGTYSVSETVPSGWDLTSSTCSDGSSPGSISLQAGETVTCTFTNTKRGSIIVDKVTNPSADPQSFTFTPSYGSNFSLTDTATPNNSGFLVPGTYSVSETVPSGWDLTSSTCSDGSSPGSISLQAGETVTCTFTNTKRGHVIVDKVTNPSADPQSFAFTTGGSGYSGFSLTDTATPNDQELVPGNYSVTETVPAGWNLTNLVCLSNLGISTTNTTSPPLVSITLAAGDRVTCTFTNGKPVISPATKEASNDATGSLTVFKPEDTIKYTVVLSNTGGSTLLDGAGDEFTDTITAPGVLLNDFPTASSGTITYNATTRTYSWNGSIPAGGSVTLTFKVKIMKGVENGTRICNQGTAKKNNNGDTVLTSDPTPLTGAPGMQTCIEVNAGLPATERPILCGLRCLSISDLDRQPIAVQIFSLSGRQLYASGWMIAGTARQVEKIEQRLANGVYLYLIRVKGANGQSLRIQLKKVVIQR
jgi:uncharacterized repeat protein (TIGR01451 family)